MSVLGNNSKEMDFLNSRLQQHMPQRRRVAVDSIPSIAQIYDVSNATLAAQDPNVQLPAEFYEPKVRATLDKIAYDEECSPFHENKEYRELGIGALLGDVGERLIQAAESRGKKPRIRMALSGCHDSSIVGLVSSLGLLMAQERTWPPYGSSVAVELFRERGNLAVEENDEVGPRTAVATNGFLKEEGDELPIGRTRTAQLTSRQRSRMKDYFVRVQFNGRPMTVPGCRKEGKHLDGDESFCTLVRMTSSPSILTKTMWLVKEKAPRFKTNNRV